MFDKKPMCEICGKKEATHFTLERPDTTDNAVIKMEGKWRFVCQDEDGYNEFTHISIERFFKTPSATVDLMAHTHEKDWMNWDNFMDMIHRFRTATGSFFKS
jgi:hypothetical protein